MNFNGIDFDTYFKNYPDANGFFGKYGGSYVSDDLKRAMEEITEAYFTICKSSKFISELRRIRKDFRADLLLFLTLKGFQTSLVTFSSTLSAKTLITRVHTSSTTVWAKHFSQSIWARRRLSQRRVPVSTALLSQPLLSPSLSLPAIPLQRSWVLFSAQSSVSPRQSTSSSATKDNTYYM